MFLESVKITGIGVMQIFLLGLVGYFLVKKNILGKDGLSSLSRLVIDIALPLLIFCQLVKGFSFSLYRNWWVFPLISLAVTVAGLVLGFLFNVFIKGAQQRLQFLSLVTFQNSGYLPLALIAALLPKNEAEPVFIYLFLFLLGFNLAMWSLGIYILSFHENRKFEWARLFSPPVVATLFSLAVIFTGLHNFIPQGVLKPLQLVGDCTLPLALFVVGGNLACIRLESINKKAIILMALAKLIILPLLGLLLIIKLNLPQPIGLLILIELAMPPATSLSVIAAHYKKEDLLISQGIFFGHIASVLTIPVFLSLYFARIMVP